MADESQVRFQKRTGSWVAEEDGDRGRGYGIRLSARRCVVAGVLPHLLRLL